MARIAKLLELFVKNGKVADALSRVKLQTAAGDTVSDDLKSIAGSCGRPSKRAKLARPYKNLSTTSSMAALSALLAERQDYKIRCERLTIGNQCISGLATEARKLREKLGT